MRTQAPNEPGPTRHRAPPNETSMDPITNYSPNLSNSSPPALGEASPALGGSPPPVGDSARSISGPAPILSASAPILQDRADEGVIIEHEGSRRKTRQRPRPGASDAVRRGVASVRQGRRPALESTSPGLMTPPGASTQIAANSQILIPRQARGAVAQQIGKRLLGTREWVRLRLLVDGIVLFLASSAALFADPHVASVTSNRWLAVGFPLLCWG